MILFTAPENWPFASSLVILVGIAVIEGVGLLFASSPALWLDHMLPDLPDSVDGPLGWLHLGRVPLLVLLILFLTGFSVSGYVIQAVAYSVSGGLLPSGLATIPAVLAGLSTLRGVGAVFAKLGPLDHTSAVSEQTLIGRSGVVVRGVARQGLAAEAKVRDQHGHMHYVMVEPDLPDETLAEGSAVLLVRKVGVSFRCIVNPHPELL